MKEGEVKKSYKIEICQLCKRVILPFQRRVYLKNIEELRPYCMSCDNMMSQLGKACDGIIEIGEKKDRLENDWEKGKERLRNNFGALATHLKEKEDKKGLELCITALKDIIYMLEQAETELAGRDRIVDGFVKVGKGGDEQVKT